MARKAAQLIFIFIFMIAFLSIMITVVFNMIEGMGDFGPPWFFFLPFVLVFILIFGVIIYSVISGIRNSRKTVNSPYQSSYTQQHPMNYEKKASLNYCRYCGANLGTSDPAKCPECKNKLKDDFYH